MTGEMLPKPIVTEIPSRSSQAELKRSNRNCLASALTLVVPTIRVFNDSRVQKCRGAIDRNWVGLVRFSLFCGLTNNASPLPLVVSMSMSGSMTSWSRNTLCTRPPQLVRHRFQWGSKGAAAFLPF
ncbi:hypothetical protein M404DRAFT_546746 [Pisolithus tinctorius Marx 270]|uniref:Uncharacterized protein n=1 Tax=Pisolithus tinctorius Marx 270 TaxID=870435 RepID=A0A0C3NU34_PISTI|nr:hypothetical protein M404DRAFT_546746 [Pisolithus tinctorius Marx 270]